MVQAKTSDFQPLPLKILNVLSLLAGASLLVAVSWEILLGDPRHYSTDYLLLQGIVCVVFLADFFARMWMADHSWRFFFRNLYFFLLSVPYLNIVDWMGIELSHAEAMLMGLVPLLRALLGLYVLFTWIINNRVTRLLTSYVLSMLVFTYFAALIFYDYEIEVNPALHDFGDAIWWASMNLTTVGADIFAVTAVGKILTVLLPTLGMMMFPIFTVYVTQIYTRNRKSDSDQESDFAHGIRFRTDYFFCSRSRSRISVSNNSSLDGSGTGAGAASCFFFISLFIILTIRKTQKARIAKSTHCWMNAP